MNKNEILVHLSAFWEKRNQGCCKTFCLEIDQILKFQFLYTLQDGFHVYYIVNLIFKTVSRIEFWTCPRAHPQTLPQVQSAFNRSSANVIIFLLIFTCRRNITTFVAFKGVPYPFIKKRTWSRKLNRKLRWHATLKLLSWTLFPSLPKFRL